MGYSTKVAKALGANKSGVQLALTANGAALLDQVARTRDDKVNTGEKLAARIEARIKEVADESDS